MRKDKDNSDNGNILHPRGDDDDVVSTGSRSSKTRGSQQLSKLVSGEKKKGSWSYGSMFVIVRRR